MSRFTFRIIIFLLLGIVVVIGASQLVFRRHRAAGVRSAARENSEINTQVNPDYEAPRKIADLKDRAVKESSGLAASRTTPGSYWTLNDSGDGPFIYAFDSTAQRQGVWRVTGAKARDWESMAAGPGPESNRHFLYVGDTGSNSERRTDIVIYRFPEPTITATDTQTSKAKPALTAPADVINLQYPDGGHDAEALLVHPTTGNIYVVTKVAFGNPSVYLAVAPFATTGTITLKRLGEIQIPSMLGGMITDGAISPDGSRVVLCDYLRGYELVLGKNSDFDSIWKQVPAPIRLGERKQGEAVTYRLDGRALVATSEGLPTPLLQISRR